MPHDKHGNLLKEDDLVTTKARVKTVSSGQDYCNLTLETVEPMYPGTDKATIVVNARQVVKSLAALLVAVLLLGGGSAFGQCSSSYGSSYRVVRPTYSSSYPAPVTYQKKIVNEIVYTRFVAVYPLADFSSSYAYYQAPPAPQSHAAAAPGYAPAAPAATNGKPAACQELTELKQSLLLMVKSQQQTNELLQRALTPPPLPPAPAGTAPPAPRQAPPPPPAKKEPISLDARTANKQSCYICHARSAAKADGGDFVTSEDDGSIVRFTNEQLLSLVNQISTGKMPKMNARARAQGIKPLDEATAAAWVAEINRQRAVNVKTKRVEPDEVRYRYEPVVRRDPPRMRSLLLRK